jgi:hypothetical protein
MIETKLSFLSEIWRYPTKIAVTTPNIIKMIEIRKNFNFFCLFMVTIVIKLQQRAIPRKLVGAQSVLGNLSVFSVNRGGKTSLRG